MRASKSAYGTMVAVAGLAFGVSFSATGQSASASAGVQANGQSGAQTSGQTSARPSSQSIAVTDRYLTSVQTELTGRIDTKNAAVGQEVAARTKETAKLADGTTLPKGTKLVGRITRVAAQDKVSGGGSLLSLNFDHAELKSGQTVQLRSVIQTVAPAAGVSSSTVGPQSMAPVEPMGGGISSASTRGGLGGGGVLGGPMRPAAQTPGSIGVNDSPTGSIGGTSGSIDPATGSVGSTTGSIGRSTDTTMGRATTDPGAGIGPVSHTTTSPVVQAGETAASAGSRATAMPGVLLNTTDSAYSSGTLFAPGRNITLESGTQITLGVITR